MRAIFLCNAKRNIERVYSKQTQASIAELVELDGEVYCGEDITVEPEKFADVEIVFSSWGMPEFSEESIKRYLPKLKMVFYAAGSVQSFARPYLVAGVGVVSAWAANAVPVAEFSVAQIILANKGYFRSSRLFRETRDFWNRDMYSGYNGNFDETVGIIGAGMIGKHVIKLLRNFNLNIIVFDPFLSDEKAAELGVTKCGLNEVFERAFAVSNHLANNQQTKGMLGYEQFSRMREKAVFINTGRGAQVVEEDLVKVLREREDITALLDVTDPEPASADHPFFSLPNCILTPHVAGSGGLEVRRMGEYMLAELKRFILGEPLFYNVTEKMLETMA